VAPDWHELIFCIFWVMQFSSGFINVRVKLAIIHFEGKALQWHTTFVQNLPGGNLPTWIEFTKT